MEDKIKKPLRNDRRTQKTKKLLAAALQELVIEKGYDAITIQEIIDRAPHKSMHYWLNLIMI